MSPSLTTTRKNWPNFVAATPLLGSKRTVIPDRVWDNDETDLQSLRKARWPISGADFLLPETISGQEIMRVCIWSTID